MTLQDATTEDLTASAMLALESLEGSNAYTPGPYPITVRPFAVPPVVIYQAADGATYERDMTPEVEGESLNVVLGDRREVKARTVWVPVEASFTFSEGQGFAGKTTKKGRIFRAGKYPDKGVEITNDDIRQFVKNFPAGGVPLMSEHADSLIGTAMEEDGARLIRVWSENGDSELHGETEYPNWLAYGLRKITNGVSVGLDMLGKTLSELSLTKWPRVADAALFRHEAAVAFSQTPDFKTFAASHPEEAKRIATEAAKAPDPAKPMNPQQIKEAAWTTFSADPKNAGVTRETFEAAFSTTAEKPKTEPTEADKRIEALERQNADFARKQAERDDEEAAKNFYADLMDPDKQKDGAKTCPAEREVVVAAFAAARAADRATLATFSENAEGSHEAKLRKEFEGRGAIFRKGPGAIVSTHHLSLETANPFSNEALGIQEKN